MKSVTYLNLLLRDLDISDDIVEAICLKYSLTPIYYQRLLKTEIRENKSHFAKTAISYFDKGEVVPDHVVYTFFEQLLLQFQDPNLLLVDFPNTYGIAVLNTILQKDNYRLEKGWYLKQNSADEFRKFHFEKQKNKFALEKYGSVEIKIWNEGNIYKKNVIAEILKTYNAIPWTVLSVSVEDLENINGIEDQL